MSHPCETCYCLQKCLVDCPKPDASGDCPYWFSLHCEGFDHCPLDDDETQAEDGIDEYLNWMRGTP